MEKEKFIENAIEEILNPTLEITKQYLEVLEVELENGKPKIERYENDSNRNFVAVYFPIKNEEFFLKIHLTKNAEIDFVWIQNAHKTYLTATSENLTYSELAKLLQKEQIEGWSKGEIRNNGNSKHTFSRIKYEPNKSKCYELNNHLEELLAELEKNRENILKLTEKANAYISVCKYQYVSGNAGINFDNKLIERLAKLNLGIDIDIFIVGKPIK